MLAGYCQHFPLVELNFTFYQLPSAATLARLAEQTPPGFQFLVKLPRTLSHEEDPRDLAGFRQAVIELQRRRRLLGLLCQLPQATHRSRRHENWLDQMARELAEFHLAVEFRHHSWAAQEVTEWLRERHLDLVAVDVPDLDRLYPRGLVYSGPRIYVRFHSRTANNWYLSDKERYDYDYSDEALTDWIEALQTTPPGTTSAWLLFNNCHRAQAAANAQRLRQLLAERSAGKGPAAEGFVPLEVIDPFGLPPAGMKQGLLFD
jgi:uncharacterized protein YecE (DUF72 family)